MRYEGNQRYQFQPRHVKLWRWLRHMPWTYAQAAYALAWWFLFTRCKPQVHLDNRWLEAKLIWGCWMGEADFKMGHYWSFDEVKERTNKRPGDRPFMLKRLG